MSGGDELVTKQEFAALLARVSAAEAFIAALKGAIGGGAPNDGAATDRELDGPHGDPVIKYAAKDWTGGPVVNKKLSATSIEYLEFLIDGNVDYARYLRSKGDAKSLKWLRRMQSDDWKAPEPAAAPARPRNPWAKPEPEAADDVGATSEDENDDSEIPF